MRSLLLSLTLIWLAAACSSNVQKPMAWAAPEPTHLDGQRAMQQVEAFVALGLKDPGTPGAARAAEWLADELRRLGLQVEIDTFEEQTSDGPIVFRNVIGTLRGRDPAQIILVSHYDTKTGMPDGFQGANDGGSSSGLLLELARVSPKDLVFAFVDGEECRYRYSSSDGLHGSRHLVRRLQESGQTRNVMAALVLDMIGDADLSVTVPRNSSPELVKRFFDAARDEGVRHKFQLYSSILDDHVPFLQAGIPAIDIIDFQFGSAPGLNDYWHTGADTLDKLSPETLQQVGRITLRSVNGLLRADER